MPGEQDTEELQKKLIEYCTEHRDLDQVITHLSEHNTSDRLQVLRLKKRKLWLKDQIEQIRNQLLPDIIA